MRDPIVRSCPVSVTDKAVVVAGTDISSLVPGARPGELGEVVAGSVAALFAPDVLVDQYFSDPFIGFEGRGVPMSVTQLLFVV